MKIWKLNPISQESLLESFRGKRLAHVLLIFFKSKLINDEKIEICKICCHFGQ